MPRRWSSYRGDGLYRLTPRTGRTHQLRVHMASLGLPIIGDPLYPNVIDVAPDDFSTPLRLLAHSLEFDDPITGSAPVRQRAQSRAMTGSSLRLAVTLSFEIHASRGGSRKFCAGPVVVIGDRGYAFYDLGTRRFGQRKSEPLRTAHWCTAMRD